MMMYSTFEQIMKVSTKENTPVQIITLVRPNIFLMNLGAVPGN